MNILRMLICASLFWAAPSVAQVTVFDNFGPNWDYNWGLGWSVAGINSGNDFGVEQAMGFVPSEGGILADLWVAFAYVPFDPGTDIVSLRLALDEGNRPGTVLEEWTLQDFGTWSQWNPPIHLESSGGVLLEAGVRYWLWAVPGIDTWTLWDMNNVGDVGPHTLRREGEDWLPVGQETRSVFRVDVTASSGAAMLAQDATGCRLATTLDEHVRIEFDLMQAAPVTIEIFDLQGRRLGRRDLGFCRVGHHRITWEERLAVGVHWAKLTYAGRTVTTRFLQIR